MCARATLMEPLFASIKLYYEVKCKPSALEILSEANVCSKFFSSSSAANTSSEKRPGKFHHGWCDEQTQIFDELIPFGLPLMS